MTELVHARLTVPRAHPIFAGHFPGLPLVPGVLLLDWAMREVATVLGLEPHRLRIRDCKFLGPLHPEEEASLLLDLQGPRTGFRILRGEQPLASGVLEQR